MDSSNVQVNAGGLSEFLEHFASVEPGERTWLSLAEQLLRRAADASPDAVEWRALSERACYGDLRPGLEAELLGVLLADSSASYSTFVDRDLIAKLRVVVERNLAGWARDEYRRSIEAISAHALASVIDQVLAHTFEEWFRSEIHLEVRAERAYYVPEYDPRQFVGVHSVNTRPIRLPTRSLDSTTHLRLGDKWTSAYGLTIDYEHWHHLSPLSGLYDLKVAAAQPNLSLAEYDLEDVSTGEVRNHGPLDPEGQHETLLKTITRAAALGVEVLVFPEYSLHSSWRDELQSATEKLSKSPTLIVAGTSEVFDGGSGERVENHAFLMVSGGFGLTQGKVFAAEMGSRIEGIGPVSSVRVFRSECWSIAVLICRDAMSSELTAMLGRCGVNLLLVPAFSERTGTIISLASSLGPVSQAFAIVAVGPAVWTDKPLDSRPPDAPRRDEAAFVGPYELHPATVVAPSGGVEGRKDAGSGMWVFDASQRSVQWMGFNQKLPIVAPWSLVWQTVAMAAKATVDVLRSLTRKIAGEKPDLRAATGVVNDIGRVLAGAPTADVRAMQAEVASLREALERCKDVSELKPSEILQGPHGRIFLAGAMWGADEMVSAYVAQSNRDVDERSDTSVRAVIVDAAMQLLRGGPTTPTAIRRVVEQRGVAVRPDQISKALGELIARGKVASTNGPEGSDRRSRYYTLTD